MSLFNAYESFGKPKSHHQTETWLKTMLNSDSHPNRAIYAMLGGDPAKKDVNSYFFFTREEAEQWKAKLPDYFYPILELDLSEMGASIPYVYGWKTQWTKGKVDFTPLSSDPRIQTFDVTENPKYPNSLFLEITPAAIPSDPFPYDELFNKIAGKYNDVKKFKVYAMGPDFIAGTLKEMMPDEVNKIIDDPAYLDKRIENFKNTYPWMFPDHKSTALPKDPFAGDPASGFEMGNPQKLAYAHAMLAKAGDLKPSLKVLQMNKKIGATTTNKLMKSFNPAARRALAIAGLASLPGAMAFSMALAAEESALNPKAKSQVDSGGNYAFGYWQLRTSNRTKLARQFKLAPLENNYTNSDLQGQYAGYLLKQVAQSIYKRFDISDSGVITPKATTGPDSKAAWNAGWRNMYLTETKGAASRSAAFWWLVAAKWGVGFMRDTEANLKAGAGFSKARHAIMLAASGINTIKQQTSL